MECPIKGRALVYGPFISRRRGISIGINLFPGRKTCSFNCVYCFRGATQYKVNSLVDDLYGIKPSNLYKALEKAYECIRHIDAIDFSGNGEPTLHIRFSEFIDVVRRFCHDYGLDPNVGVFTNASTLYMLNVLNALKKLDTIEAKLDTCTPWKYKIINRPCKSVNLDMIINGLIKLRKEYSGKLIIQIMLLKYYDTLNYTARDSQLMAEVLNMIKPDEVHIYTTYRKPRLKSIKRVNEDDMRRFSEALVNYGFNVKIYPH